MILDHGDYMRQPGAFSAAELADLRAAILDSPLLAKNPLNRYFETTLGFSVVFQRAALPEVTSRFPAFQRYLDVALSPMANVFYLNPLVIPSGGQVMRHADLSLRSYCPESEPPIFVSVLYVAVPPGMHGGDLRLFRADDSCLATLPPQAGTLLCFRGDLRHEVTAVADCPSPRISLVCEQYALPEAMLGQVPRLTVQTSAGFAALLALEEGL